MRRDDIFEVLIWDERVCSTHFGKTRYHEPKELITNSYKQHDAATRNLCIKDNTQPIPESIDFVNQKYTTSIRLRSKQTPVHHQLEPCMPKTEKN